MLPAIPVVLVTGDVSTATVALARESGVAAVISKPFSFDNIVSATQRALRRLRIE
jgi:CheY-like chemotaxis protein